MQTQILSTPELLAIEFSNVLKSWLTPEQMAEINILNEGYKITNPNCCATGDFCDSNMAMDEAFTKIMGREFTFNSDEEPELEQLATEDQALWNESWGIAKENKFYL